ncbi:bifunctional 4-hydroxy-3-methylbut-2-enyl diphosphate reductase/30S ribosomal protein S1 [Abyssisolibacter fermentans]|uniref:bifunctional 4-hydroxy-3-methylbut-2-enyl diphosphate reductase/30S ribosomal protein S1 n=1 Tax=Abyssisolibacter fermentans TaxID=1766203 RepID=UPI00082CE2AF|nr:bifunctional 4-hydroxy-3-methylbut-2-enyl diphosphate reductase/30S ribosomal protein S1 [Abyssisolibacter fermentans]
MEIIMADVYGFCYGVERSINTALKTVENSKNIFSLGPLIHNNQAIEFLKNHGITIIDSIDNIDNTRLIIRSHGVPLKIYEKAKTKNIDIIDCTCPFVRKIQKKVAKYHNEGYEIIIIGNPDHPEVIGINGWCNNKAYIINSKDGIDEIPNCDKICIVAQTTMNVEKFDSLVKILCKKGDEVKVFNTICNATSLRQKACFELSQKVDAMIVIGGYHSSNTEKLVSISKQHCKTYHIETIEDLDINEFQNLSTIGITAGASTPDWIIKEVIAKMSNSEEMKNIMEEYEKSFVDLTRGDVVEGTVISINKNEAMINIGYKADGILPREEYSNDPSVNINDTLNIGDKINVLIMKFDDGEGNVLLSKKRVDEIQGWENLATAYENEEIVEAKVVEVIKGGLSVVVNNIKGFVPASHASSKFMSDLSSLIGVVFDVKIIDFKNRKKLVLSRKVVQQKEEAERLEKVWSKIEKDAVLQGEVKRLTDFGAFVDIGGIDGLIHISEMSWGRVKHPSEVVSIGDHVEVIVLNFDKDKQRISLGLKQLTKHPWDTATEKYNIGDVVEGKVVKLLDFGAFVELEAGLDGLVHISEISSKHIAKPSDELTIGQSVKVRILDIKAEDKKISLSIKKVDETPQEVKPVKEKVEIDNSYREECEVSIGDILNIEKEDE